MGNKIITEKDFWMCSCGAMPAQLQGTRKSNKKESGEVYITIADTATSSWIDFGCTKHSFWGAIIAAVVAVVVVALVVGTGGIAAIGLMGMMAIGAAAGIAGGVIGAVVGALKCGQKRAPLRQWSGSKSNLLLTGTPAVTGDYTMTCKIGGTVTFAPEIKSWTHAIALGSFNYLTKFAECALGGAAVGGGGYLLSGMAAGSLSLAMPTAGSIASNIAASFTGIWGGTRLLFGANHVANEQAYGNINGAGDAAAAAVSGGIPEIDSGKRILTGQAQPGDALLLLYFLHVKSPSSKARPNSTPKEEPVPKEETSTPAEKEKAAGSKEETAAPKQETENTPNKNEGKKGEAYEAGTAPRYGQRRISDELYNELRDQTPPQEIRDMVNEGVQLPMDDPALPGKTITKKLHADHIVSMDKISRMEGFDKLTKEQQLAVLNNRENFVGLSETANTSKGSKSFQDWTVYKKENIQVDPEFRRQMMEREARAERMLQEQIDNFNSNNP